MALSVTEPIRQPAGGSRQSQTSGFLGTFADLSLGPLLVKVRLGVQLGPSHAQTVDH